MTGIKITEIKECGYCGYAVYIVPKGAIGEGKWSHVGGYYTCPTASEAAPRE